MSTYSVVPSKCYANYLAGYLRLDGNRGINPIEQVLVGPSHTYILFEPSHGDLHSYVRQRERLRESEVCLLFRQIVQIVNDCHQAGIVLRDLKLSKFVFSDTEQTALKLETLDDGVVLADPADDLLGEKHGCPAYVAPELLTNVNGRYSGRAADCWSLGVILYTMLVGRYPFHDSDPSLLFGKIKRGWFQIPNSVTPTAKCLIRSLLRKDPEERLTTEDLLASSWFQQTSGQINQQAAQAQLVHQQQLLSHHQQSLLTSLSTGSSSSAFSIVTSNSSSDSLTNGTTASSLSPTALSQQSSSPPTTSLTPLGQRPVFGSPLAPSPPPSSLSSTANQQQLLSQFGLAMMDVDSGSDQLVPEI